VIGTARRSSSQWRAVRRYWPALVFLLPTALSLVVFRLVPLLTAVDNSFYDVNLIRGDRKFIGIENFTRAFSDSDFLLSAKNTTVYALTKVPVQVAVALGFAVLVNRRLRGIVIVRSAIFLPVVTSLVVASTIWLFIFDPNSGLINSLFVGVGLPPQGLLHDANQALPAIIGMMVWKEVGLSTLFFLAGLQSIPTEYYEAARIDGANPWSSFKFITLPLLRGTLLFVLVIETVFAFRVFAPVYVMTQGGPLDATSVVVFYIYEQAFPFNSVGYATALSLILLVAITAVTLVLRRIVGRVVQY